MFSFFIQDLSLQSNKQVFLSAPLSTIRHSKRIKYSNVDNSLCQSPGKPKSAVPIRSDLLPLTSVLGQRPISYTAFRNPGGDLNDRGYLDVTSFNYLHM